MSSFVHQKKPFIVCVLRGKSMMSDVATIMNGEHDGADAFDLHINWLPEADRSPENLRRIFASTRLPMLALYYREPTPYSNPAPGEEERLAYQLRAIECGAAGIDIQADLYDPDPKSSLAGSSYGFAKLNPNEVTLNPQAVEKQIKFIDRVHSMGAEVLLSAHVGVRLSCDEGVELALELERRGPDIIKIVSPCEGDDQIIEILKTIVELKKRLHTPFVYIGGGADSALTRTVGAMFGNALVFANQRYEENSTLLQPLVGQVRTILDEVRRDVRQ